LVEKLRTWAENEIETTDQPPKPEQQLDETTPR